MKTTKTLAFILALLITVTVLVGCGYDKYNHETYYGVIRWSEDFGGLLINIPGVGDVDIPAYESCISSYDGASPDEDDNYQLRDGDLVKIHFRYERHWDSHGVPIMESYPARFGMTAYYIEVMEQGVAFEKLDTGYTFSFTEAENTYAIGDTLYVVYHHGYNGVAAMCRIAEGTVISLEGDKVTLSLTLYTEAEEFLKEYISSSIETTWWESSTYDNNVNNPPIGDSNDDADKNLDKDNISDEITDDKISTPEDEILNTSPETSGDGGSGDDICESEDGDNTEEIPDEDNETDIILPDDDSSDDSAIDDGVHEEMTPPIDAPATFTANTYNGKRESIKYWLYTPKSAKEGMPLIVYLHGGSGKGDDPNLITDVDGFPQYLRDGRVSPDAYVIVPQVSSEYRGWVEMKSILIELIEYVTELYSIDADRISLTGHSMGGTGAYKIALACPDVFSAIAPLSGSVTLNDRSLDKLKDIPIWAIVGSRDTVVDPESSIAFIEALSEINDDAKITVLSGVDHFTVPSEVFLSENMRLIDWLIAQSK